MSETTDKKYTLAKPGGSITAININGSVDVFGKSTKIRVREIIGYPIIDDEPKRVANEDDFWANIKIGTIATAVLAGAAIVVAVTATTLTGGAALAVFVLGGAATGTGLLTVTTAVTDYNTGCARSTDVFVDQLIKCGVIGAFAGAACYFMPAVAPKVGAIMGDEICTLLGISTASTGAEVIAGGIAKVGYVAIAGRTAFSVDQVCTMGSGESILLDTLFQGNQNAYDCSYMICETIALGYFDIYMQYGTTRGNQSINGDSDGDEETGIPYKNSNNNNSSNNNSSNNNNSNSKGTGQNNTSNVKLNSSVQGDADDSAGQSSGNAAKSGLYLEESGIKTVNGYDAKVNVGQQNKHIPGTNEYKNALNNGQTKSILYGNTNDIQNLLNQKAGTGDFLGTNKERVNFGKVIGQYIDPDTGIGVETTMGIIHYGKKGAHIVPARPN